MLRHDMDTLKRTVVTGDVKASSSEIWKPNDWKRISSGSKSKGTMLKILNMSKSIAPKDNIYRKIRFNCVAFSKDNVSSRIENNRGVVEALVALGDQRGHLIILDLGQNKLSTIAKIGISITCISFNHTRRKEVILGLSDNSIQSYNIDSGQLIARLSNAHKDPCYSIETHLTKSLAISCAVTEAILWDTDTWEKKRMLTGPKSRLDQAMFGPDGGSLIASFSDGTILFWTLETFSLQWKITMDRTPSISQSPLSHFYQPSSLDISKNGEFMACGGSTPAIMVWNIFEKRLVHEIVIPSLGDKPIKLLRFVGNSNTLAVLSSQGNILFIDAELAKFEGQMKGKQSFSSFSLSPNGLILAAVLADPSYAAVLLDISDISSIDIQRIQGLSQKDNEDAKTDAQVDETPARTSMATETKRHAFYQLVESKNDKCNMSSPKLKKFLQFYGEFPHEYRTVIWRFLLKLPENRSSYEILLNQGTHSSLVDFRKKFPIKDFGLARALERILSCLVFWSPLFDAVDYIPAMVFPFVKLFRKDIFSGFETILTVLTNWCQKWWEYYPNPPIEFLNIVENLLTFHDPELVSHFMNHQITSQFYAWPLMRTLFSDSVSEQDWLKLWDHIIANPPSFFPYIIVAYIEVHRKRLFEVTSCETAKQFFGRQNPIDINTLLLQSYKLQRTTVKSQSPETYLADFCPLEKGDYPVFQSYPRFIIDYQNRVRDKIREEEDEFLQKKKLTEEISRLADELRKDKASWDLADWKMTKMIEDWWDQMMADEEMRGKKKVQRELESRETRLRNLSNIAEARKSFVSQHLQAAENHLKHISKVANHDQKRVSTDEENTIVERNLEQIENEWLERRAEMIKTRNELNALRTQHVQSFAEQLNS